MKRVSLSFYQQEDVVALSQQLIGMQLFTCLDETLTGGVIVETEAYRGPNDKASHAYLSRRTKRNEVMYHAGGVCYIYICYGMHHLFNIVTHREGVPHAILIRAIEPTVGFEAMLRRRGKDKLKRNLTAGPGALTAALGLSSHQHNGYSLLGPHIWLEERKEGSLPSHELIASPRVGVDYAQEDSQLPWRFRLKQSPWTSPAK